MRLRSVEASRPTISDSHESALSQREEPAGSTAISRGLFAPVDIGFLVFFRVLFGAVMLWEVSRYFSHDWIDRYYIEPVFHFSYYGFDWVKPWGGDGMYVHFFALGVCALCILVGFCYRVAAILFFIGFTHVFLLDETQYLNHFYLICLISFVLVWLPAGRAGSVDAWLWPGKRIKFVPAWTLWLVRAQVGIPYFFGGVAKLNADWLHGEPMRGWLAARTSFPSIGRFFTEEWMVYGFVAGGLLLDLLIVPLLLYRRTRPWAFAGAVGFHLMNARLFDIGIFPWFMLAATLVFFPPEMPRRVWDAARRFLLRRSSAVSQDPSNYQLPSPLTQQMIMAALGVYLSFQLLMPLRHWLYPGNVNWTEEGHRFSWRMKLRTKDAIAQFTITDPNERRSWEVDSLEFLTPRQEQKMSSRPDMILQFSHFLAAMEREKGRERVEVRAHVTAALNGRNPQLLIDPDVDLARELRTLWHASWIVPLTEPLRHRSKSELKPDDSAAQNVRLGLSSD